MATLSIMTTHLGPHCIEKVFINPLICGHPSIMAEIFGPNGGHYRRVPLYIRIAKNFRLFFAPCSHG